MNTFELAVTVEQQDKKGASLVGLRNYETKTGEVSNYRVSAYSNAFAVRKAHEKEALSCVNTSTMIEALSEHESEHVLQAYNELVKARSESPDLSTTLRSQAQIDAYTHKGGGIKEHDESESVKIQGFVLSKTLVKSAEENTGKPKKPVKSKPETLAKRAIEKYINKFVDKRAFCAVATFTVNKAAIVRTNGKSLSE